VKRQVTVIIVLHFASCNKTGAVLTRRARRRESGTDIVQGCKRATASMSRRRCDVLGVNLVDKVVDEGKLKSFPIQ